MLAGEGRHVRDHKYLWACRTTFDISNLDHFCNLHNLRTINVLHYAL